MACVCLLIGLPGSGKSTLCNFILHNNDTNLKFIYFNYDKIISTIDFAKHSEVSQWKTARKNILKNAEEHINDYKKELSNNISNNENKNNENEINIPQIVLLIDDNMYYRGMRKEYYQLCCKHEIGFCLIYLNCSLKICLSRNSKRNNPVPESTIYKMAAQLEEPNSSSTTWEKDVLFLNTCSNDLNYLLFWGQIKSVIQNSLENPVFKPKLSTETEKSQLLIKKNFLHQLDLVIRKYIHSEMKTAKKFCNNEEIKQKFEQMNAVKNNIFELVHCGYIIEQEYIGHNGEICIELLKYKIENIMENLI